MGGKLKPQIKEVRTTYVLYPVTGRRVELIVDSINRTVLSGKVYDTKKDYSSETVDFSNPRYADLSLLITSAKELEETLKSVEKDIKENFVSATPLSTT